MLEKPNIEEKEIIRCLRDAYALDVVEVIFLPLGADFNTAVYRVVTGDSRNYFLKLRRDEFNEASLFVPYHLAKLGNESVISPLEATNGCFWGRLDSFWMALYPYVKGHSGLDVMLSDQQWIGFGQALKKFHTYIFPPLITNSLPQETYSPKWRKCVTDFLDRLESEAFQDPIASEMAHFLKTKSAEIRSIIQQAEKLADVLKKQSLSYIVCHGDIHEGNLLIDTKGELLIVDWDTLILAPKERDLMFAGAGIGALVGISERSQKEEESLFYQGYGQVDINHEAISYYRLERVIEDIGASCQQIFLTDEGGDDRAQSFKYLKANFAPNSTLDRVRLSPI